MPVHVRVEIRDETGTLAELTHALARAGADVLSVQVTDRSAGRAIDDFLLAWPHDTDVAAIGVVGEPLLGVRGSRVLGVRRVATVPEENAAIDLLTQVLWQPQRAVETLADLVPGLLNADWAAIALRGTTARLLYASAGAPTPLPSLPGDFPRALAFTHPVGSAVSAPLPRCDLALIAVRREGPPFLRREVDELARTVDLVTSLADALRAPAARSVATLVTGRLAHSGEAGLAAETA